MTSGRMGGELPGKNTTFEEGGSIDWDKFSGKLIDTMADIADRNKVLGEAMWEAIADMPRESQRMILKAMERRRES